MKTIIVSFLLFASAMCFAQNPSDTVMLSNKFTEHPEFQKYQLSSLMNYTSACNTSFALGLIGAGCFAATLIPNLNGQSIFMFMMCGSICIGSSIGFHISAINMIDNPTNIVPVK